MWSNKEIDIGDWSICGGGRLERLYGIRTQKQRQASRQVDRYVKIVKTLTTGDGRWILRDNLVEIPIAKDMPFS